MSNSQVFFFGDSLTDVRVVFGALVETLEAQIFQGILAELGPEPTPEQLAFAKAQANALAFQQATATAQALNFGAEFAVTNEFTHAAYFEDVSGAIVQNFANAGARAIGIQEPFGEGTGYDANLGGQLARFAQLEHIDPSSTAILFIGANDFSDAFGAAVGNPNAAPLDIITAAGQAVQAILGAQEAAARSLDALGVGTIYLGTQPGGSFFPESDALDGLSGVVADITLSVYNAGVVSLANTLRSEGIDAQVMDYAAVSKAIVEDPTGFGIVAERLDFLSDGSAFDSDQVAFWDPIHPAEAIHQAWGIYADFVMNGGSTASLSDFGTVSFQTNGSNAVFANGGNDTVFTFGGNDVVFGGTGNDSVFAGRHDDIVSGGQGADKLNGQSGNDILSGGIGDDTLHGGSGHDVLIDGLGNDFVKGGRGNDIFIFVESTLQGSGGPSSDVLLGGRGHDTLYLVLDEATFDAFGSDGVSSTLDHLGISTSSIEAVIAIDGRAQVETALGGFDWFQTADYWGLVPAPTVDPIA